ncbi:d-aminoacyl-trna deacylase dtda [Lucifera butyrica]|uniref:D-aminoacyl-trna deacylase dtda n=1 Tax=Lucifera butyrica TaxID=1351585 RepID=A0A498QY73_9FIRM|nr:D-aminoacyl-tRNA deacylase [Lucifera butyrica]VBB05126.1 d-aminoacyl-trna deacylase dtda [Lucifera butyrica]
MVMTSGKAVYFFCSDETKDPVAGHVLREALKLYNFDETDIIIDKFPMFKHTDKNGNLFCYVQTSEVLSHNYPKYLPILNYHFADFDIAGIVNWHGGQNAPDGILTVHTTGDVETGFFSPVKPLYMRNLLLSLKQNCEKLSIRDFIVTCEATHWSGIPHNGNASMIPLFQVPIIDIEIGSSPIRWADQGAARVIASALSNVFTGDSNKLLNLLCIGGIHFEPAFANVLFQNWDGYAFAISHILAGRWLIAGKYDTEEGLVKLETCLKSIQDTVDGIIFHDSLKSGYKEQCRILAKKYDIPIFKHQLLRKPIDIFKALSKKRQTV